MPRWRCAHTFSGSALPCGTQPRSRLRHDGEEDRRSAQGRPTPPRQPQRTHDDGHLEHGRGHVEDATGSGVQRAGPMDAGNAAVLGVWALSRTAGVPIGPARWTPEPVGVFDMASAVFEVAVIVGALWLARQMFTRSSATRRSSSPSWRSRLRGWVPQGSALPEEVWAQRHRGIVALLWLHAPGVFIFALTRHVPLPHAAFEGCVVVTFALTAMALHRHRRPAAVVAALGLLTCSAILVYESGGVIEMHFHYFVVVGVITLYQDWWPFLTAIGYVVLQHGVLGVIDPVAVYNHQSAVDHPWQWAGIHGLFVLAHERGRHRVVALERVACWQA